MVTKILPMIVTSLNLGVGTAIAMSPDLENFEDRFSYTVGMDVGHVLSEQVTDLNIELLAASLRATYAGENQSMNQDFRNPEDRRSYDIGHDIGQRLRERAINFDMELLVDGLRTAYMGNETLMAEGEAQAVREEFLERRQSGGQQEPGSVSDAPKNSVQEDINSLADAYEVYLTFTSTCGAAGYISPTNKRSLDTLFEKLGNLPTSSGENFSEEQRDQAWSQAQSRYKSTDNYQIYATALQFGPMDPSFNGDQFCNQAIAQTVLMWETMISRKDQPEVEIERPF